MLNPLNMDFSKLSENERETLIRQLGGAKIVGGERPPVKCTEGVSIRSKRFPVTVTEKDADGNDMEQELPGAFREFWFLQSTRELVPGTKHHVATKRHLASLERQKKGEVKSAWPPVYVQVGALLGVDHTGPEKVWLYTYDRLKSDGTKRDK